MNIYIHHVLQYIMKLSLIMSNPIDGWKPLGKMVSPDQRQGPVVGWQQIAPHYVKAKAEEVVHNVLDSLGDKKMSMDELLAAGIDFVPTQVEAGRANTTIEKIQIGQALVQEERVACANACLVRRPTIPRTGEILLDSCEDAAGITVGPDGKLKSFVIADGVSETLNGKVAAVLAVKEAMILQTNRTDDTGIDNVQKKLASMTNWDEYGSRYRREKAALLQTSLDPMMAQVQRMKLSVNEKGELIEARGKKMVNRINTIAATTLLMGEIDNGKLMLSKIGNTVCVVVSADGKTVCFGNGKESNHLKVKESRAEGTESLVHPLTKGDRIYAFTDGAFVTNLEECLAVMKSGNKNTKKDVINTILSKVGHDDCVILAIDY